jgi:hypothetical protein
MVSEIIKGIAVGIKNEFGDDSTIYTEQVEQGFKTPCFFIEAKSPERKKISIKRYCDIYHFDICYFPSMGMKNSKCHGVGMRLFDAMEKITLLDGSVMMGKDTSYDIVDKTLHFKVSFKAIFQEVEDKVDIMENIETHIKEK